MKSLSIFRLVHPSFFPSATLFSSACTSYINSRDQYALYMSEACTTYAQTRTHEHAFSRELLRRWQLGRADEPLTQNSVED